MYSDRAVSAFFGKVITFMLLLASLPVVIYMMRQVADVLGSLPSKREEATTTDTGGLGASGRAAAADVGGQASASTDLGGQPSSMWIEAAGILLIALLVVAASWWAVRVIVRRRRARRAEAGAAAQLRDTQLERWHKGAAAFTRTATALTAFETDPESIFVRPLLFDTREPASAAFYDAFAAADKLHLETVPHDDALIDAFVDASYIAERAFGAADGNARRKARRGITHGDRHLTPTELRAVARARKLLAVAMNSATSSAHARTSYAKVADLLDGIVDVPEEFGQRVLREIEAAHRAELPEVASPPAR